jgi:hypothetical protein
MEGDVSRKALDYEAAMLSSALRRSMSTYLRALYISFMTWYQLNWVSLTTVRFLR